MRVGVVDTILFKRGLRLVRFFDFGGVDQCTTFKQEHIGCAIWPWHCWRRYPPTPAPISSAFNWALGRAIGASKKAIWDSFGIPILHGGTPETGTSRRLPRG